MLDFLHLALSRPDPSLLYAGHYDPLLVTLSVGVAVLAAYTSFMVSHYVAASPTAATKGRWILVGGLCMGAGVWAMHFTGMLAFSLPCTTAYDPTLTLLSMIPAVLACSLAVGIISRERISPPQLAAGGLLIGAGIGAMHYAGMAAYRLNGVIRYDLKLFLLSIVVAVALATLALWVKFRLQDWRARWRPFAPTAGALVMGLAVSAMHYTAMTSAYFIRNGDLAVAEPQLVPAFLASIVLAVTTSIILTTLAATFLTRPTVHSFAGIHRSLALLIAGWGVVAWLGSSYYSAHRADDAYREGLERAQRQVDGVGEDIGDALATLQGIPQVLAEEETLKAQLRRFGPEALALQLPTEERKRLWLRDPGLARLDDFLATAATGLKADALWVIDAAADCVAASNAGLLATFVGTNYGDRQYFRQAQDGRPGRQYAVGHVSKLPGLYYSYPVGDRGRFIGAVVAKRDLAGLLRYTRPANAFIVDANGVIVLADDRNLEYRTMPGATVAALTATERSLQYRQAAFAPLELRPWREKGYAGVVLVGGEAQPQALVSQALPDSGITIYVARPLPELSRIESEQPWVFFLILVAGSMLIVAVTAVVLNVRATRLAKETAEEAVAQLEEHKLRLEQIAHYDVLTGLPNRALLGDRMEQALAQTRRGEHLMAVCYLDLDGFKPINDSLGHEAGDRLLVEIAGRLKGCLRGGDTVARMGGDEFVLLLLGLARNEEWEAALRRILEAASRPVTLAGKTVAISASLGVTVFPADDADGDTLIRHADQAMYLAKQAGKNGYHLFDPEQDRRARSHLEQLSGIEAALRNDEFVLHYQPKVNMRRGTVFGAEALIRWRHPERGLLPPGEFLPAIEHTDQIVAIGDWAIATALRQVAAWHDRGLGLTVSVNIAARHLLRQDFVARLRDHLAACPGAPRGSLELEVLETAALEDIGHVARIIRECQELGVGFALDDFGTGYSSLTYLKLLPVETLKIDQTFVRDMITDPEDMAIIEGVIGLAEVFRRRVVAEGVETAEHGVRLLALGCELAQGYGIARPMPAAHLADWVRHWQPDARWLAPRSAPRPFGLAMLSTDASAAR